jgi:hypothetical protein
MISNFDNNFYTLYKKYKNKYINLKYNILEGGNNNKVDKIFYELINNKYYIEADIQRYNSFIKSSILKDDIKQKLYYKEKEFNEIKFNEIKKEYKRINFFNKKQLILETIEIIIKNKSSQKKKELLRIRNNIIIIINNLNDFIKKNLFDVQININNLEEFTKIPESEIKISDQLINELNNIKDILENNKTQSTTNCTYKTVIQLPINENITNCNIEDLKKLQEIYKSDLQTINDYYTTKITALKKSIKT